MKRLHIFMLKSYIGPFIATFFISMFVLIMQFLWRMIDELVGKGLEVSVIAEFLFDVALTLSIGEKTAAEYQAYKDRQKP